MFPAENVLGHVASFAIGSADVIPSAPPVSRVSLGLLTYCFAHAQKAYGKMAGVPNYNDPVVFIEGAASLGASAIQFPFGVCDREKVRAVRDAAERFGIALESTLALPRGDGERGKFEAELSSLRGLGVEVARTVVFPGRRYEDLRNYAEYLEALQQARQRLRTAEPIARRFGIRLAVENHKDQRVTDRIQLLKEIDSEYVGACIDVGNNLSLLEDPLEVCRALAPWALTVHFKDQGLQEYDDGFLLADVPLGEGCIDLPAVIVTIRAIRPRARFQLELITRDPLKVPVLRETYWATLAEVKAEDLGRTWSLVKKRGSRVPFPLLGAMSEEHRVALERKNVEQSFRYAATHLDLKT